MSSVTWTTDGEAPVNPPKWKTNFLWFSSEKQLHRDKAIECRPPPRGLPSRIHATIEMMGNEKMLKRLEDVSHFIDPSVHSAPAVD